MFTNILNKILENGNYKHYSHNHNTIIGVIEMHSNNLCSKSFIKSTINEKNFNIVSEYLFKEIIKKTCNSKCESCNANVNKIDYTEIEKEFFII